MRTAAIFAIAFVITSVFFIDFCNLVYGCGCRSLWAGADAHCNRHDHSPGAKHCPFCSHGDAGYAVFFGGIVVPQFATAWASRRRSWWAQLGATVAMFPVVGGILAVSVGLLDGYWLPR